MLFQTSHWFFCTCCYRDLSHREKKEILYQDSDAGELDRPVKAPHHHQQQLQVEQEPSRNVLRTLVSNHSKSDVPSHQMGSEEQMLS